MDPRIKSWAWEATLLLLVVFIVAYSWSFTAVQLPQEVALARRIAQFLGQDLDTHKPAEWIHLMRTWVAIPVTLVGFQVMRRTLKFLNMDAPATDLASLGWVLGTTMFAYSTTLTGHQIAAVGLLTGFYAMLRAEFEQDIGQARSRYLVGWSVLAGLSLTLVLVVSPPAILLVTLLVIYGVFGPLRRAPQFLLLWLSLLVPGVMFVLIDHPSGVSLFTEVVGQWAFDATALRVLIAANPILCVMPFAFLVLISRKSTRLAGLILAGSVIAIAQGMGEVSAVGAAAVVPALVFVGIGLGFAADAALSLAIPHGLVKGVAVAGMIYHPTLQAFVPKFREAENPLVDLIPHMWKAKIVAPNLGQNLFGLSGTESLIPLMIAVVIVVGVVLGRGATWLDAPRRLPLVIIAVGVLATHLAILSHFGGHLPPDKQKKIMRTIDVWNQHESSFRKDANKAVQAIDAIGR